MNENENENELGQINHSIRIDGAGDGPQEIAIRVREAIERAGHYVPSDGFIEFHNHRTIEEANVAIYARGEYDLGDLMITGDEGLTTFRGGNTLDMSDFLKGVVKIACYLCDRKLDIQYRYITEKIKNFLPLNFHHVCCYCHRWIESPGWIRNVIGEKDSPLLLIVCEHTSHTVNIFHLIRYLSTMDQLEANVVRKKFAEYEVPLDSKILRDFYK